MSAAGFRTLQRAGKSKESPASDVVKVFQSGDDGAVVVAADPVPGDGRVVAGAEAVPVPEPVPGVGVGVVADEGAPGGTGPVPGAPAGGDAGPSDADVAGGVVGASPDGPGFVPQDISSKVKLMAATDTADPLVFTCLPGPLSRRLATGYFPAGRSEVIMFRMSSYSAVSV